MPSQNFISIFFLTERPILLKLYKKYLGDM